MTMKILIQIHLVNSMKNQNGLFDRFEDMNPRSEAVTPILRNPRKIDQRQTQGAWKLCDKCANQYTLTVKAREILRHFTLVTSSTTPVNKIYAKPWSKSFKRFGWRRLQFQK